MPRDVYIYKKRKLTSPVIGFTFLGEDTKKNHQSKENENNLVGLYIQIYLLVIINY